MFLRRVIYYLVPISNGIRLWCEVHRDSIYSNLNQDYSFDVYY